MGWDEFHHRFCQLIDACISLHFCLMYEKGKRNIRETKASEPPGRLRARGERRPVVFPARGNFPSCL